MSTLLLVMAGRTDLQVVVQEGARKVRIEPGGTFNGLRGFHERLLDPQGPPWAINEDAVDLPQGATRPGGGGVPAECLKDPDERLRLVPAKLKRVLDDVVPRRVDAAVIFATQRDRDAEPNEPVAVGPVLAGWIAARSRGRPEEARAEAHARLQPWDPGTQWPGGVQWVNLLPARERLEGTAPLTRPIAKPVLDRLKNSLIALQSAHTPPLHVIITTGGGFPKLKPVLVAAASLIFGADRVEVVEEPQGAHGAEAVQPRGGKPVQAGGQAADARSLVVRVRPREQKLPEEAYRLREAALQCVREGDLQAAAAFARRAQGDSWENGWTQPVVLVADWLAGRRAGVRVEAGPPYLDWLQAPPRCLLAAVRAEAALRGDRIHEAVIASVTFADAARVDAVERLGWVKEVNELHGTLTVNAALPEGIVLPVHRWWQQEYVCFDEAGGVVDAVWNDVDEATRAAVNDVRGRLSRPPGRGPSPKMYRNRAVHGRLTGRGLHLAETAFVAAGVWSARPVLRFLHAGGPAAAVLEHLGVPDAPRLVQDMFQGLESAIVHG